MDYEYERKGVVANFLFTQTLGGWRKVHVQERRTAIDWVLEIKDLLDNDYPTVEKVVLVCDNLNTHRIASLFEAYVLQEARWLTERLEIHNTPKHGSWLSVAECELGAFTKQCLGRRIPAIEILRKEAKAWYRQRNKAQKSVDWQFTTQNARIKLKRLYPQIQS